MLTILLVIIYLLPIIGYIIYCGYKHQDIDGGLIARRKSVLNRLEVAYKKFVEAKKDREEFKTNDGRLHSFKTYESERDRMFNEITLLKVKLHA